MFGSLLRWRVPIVGAAALAALLLPGAYAASAPAAESTYIVQLAEPPLALYGGGIAGLAPTMPAARGATRLNPSSPESVAYLGHLETRQNAVKATRRIRAVSEPHEKLPSYAPDRRGPAEYRG